MLGPKLQLQITLEHLLNSRNGYWSFSSFINFTEILKLLKFLKKDLEIEAYLLTAFCVYLALGILKVRSGRGGWARCGVEEVWGGGRQGLERRAQCGVQRGHGQGIEWGGELGGVHIVPVPRLLYKRQGKAHDKKVLTFFI